MELQNAQQALRAINKLRNKAFDLVFISTLNNPTNHAYVVCVLKCLPHSRQYATQCIQLRQSRTRQLHSFLQWLTSKSFVYTGHVLAGNHRS